MAWLKSIPPKMLHDKLGIYHAGGWHAEMDRCWVDGTYCVCSRIIRTQFGNVEHVTITRGGGTCDGSGEVTWAEKMRIKNELFGENRFAIEVFPKQKNLVDVCDVYHLWVFDKKVNMPFGIGKKEMVHAINRGYNITPAELETLNSAINKGETIGSLA